MTKARSTERSSWGGFAALLLASTAVLMAGPALAQAQAPGAPAPDNAATPPAAQVNDVVVTATKRAQKLQNVPIAVTALTGQVITKMGGTDLSDVAGSRYKAIGRAKTRPTSAAFRRSPAAPRRSASTWTRSR